MNNETLKLPSIKELILPTIRAIESIGGDASNAEISPQVSFITYMLEKRGRLSFAKQAAREVHSKLVKRY